MANTIQDAKITVSLDTEGAKRELAELKKELAVDASKIRVNKVLQRKAVKENQVAQQTAMTKAKGLAQRFGYRGIAVPDYFAGAIEIAAGIAGAIPKFIPIIGPPAGNVLSSIIRKVAPKMEMGMPFAMGAAEGLLKEHEGTLGKYFDDPDAEEDRGSALGIIEDALLGLSNKMNRLKAEQDIQQRTLTNVADGVKAQLAVGITPDFGFFENLMEWEYNKNELQVNLQHKINRTVLYKMGEGMPKAMEQFNKRGQ
jgi:hypothetical protein